MLTAAAKLLGAAFLLAAFFGISQTDPGTYIGFHPSWTNSTTGELYVWLAIPFLVFPAFFLLFDVFADELESPFRLVRERLAGLAQKPWQVAAGVLPALFAMVWAGNTRVFRGFPFTDDEWGAMYGGQLLAMGKASEPVPGYFSAMPDLFIYVRNGMMASFDWFGALVPWALADLLGAGNLVHVFLNAVSIVAVGALAWRRLGPRWGVLAAVAFVASPMALSLTFSTHAHAVSRAFLALTLVAVDALERRPDWRSYAAAGALAGAGWTVRPVEITMLLIPLAIWLLVRAVKQPNTRLPFLAFLGLGAVFVGAFTAHSFAVTGTYLPARLAPSDVAPWTDHHKPPFAFLTSPEIAWNRFGENISYNLFLLTIWVFGPAGIFLAIVGARRDTFSKLLLAGVVVDLCMGILHEDYGIHVVGPIHYSETTVPLIFLIVQGLQDLWRFGEQHDDAVPGASTRHFRVAVLGALVASNLFFGVVHLDAVRRSQGMHERIYGFLDDAKFDQSIVVARVYGDHWKAFPFFKKRGSFVYQWRRVHPAGERVIIVHKRGADIMAKLREAYPDRKAWELRTMSQAPHIEAVEYQWPKIPTKRAATK